ncbi:uncharacterized protein LOC122497875 [Leptopilina heterotoma]|uniref:uncharacterized protein LOC122497875 n=1 Tax=Leptopilina heterotoma TaxID=63436 RepID=UPI001CA81072|nr:uncharacterized protein LOC122497875 [Leptopilina heterotoma]
MDMFGRKREISPSVPRPFDIEIGTFIKNTGHPEIIKDIINQNSQENLSIFTDGSKIEEAHCVGAACYCPQLEIKLKKSINTHASIYTAECIALKEALNIALEVPNKDIYIFSDSLSVLQALNHTQFQVKVNNHLLEIKQKYNEFLQKSPESRKLKFYWIPSHVGIEENENVDELAKSATEDIIPTITKIPYTDLKPIFNQDAKIKTIAQMKEQGRVKGIDYFKYYFKDTSKAWFQKLNFPRETTVWVNRVRANHYHLAASLFKINLKDDQSCECGHPEEDVNHLLWQCQKYDNTRTKMMQKLKKFYQLPINVSSIIYDINPAAIRAISIFIKESNLKI